MNKKIYKRVTVKSLQEMKDNGEKISMLTSYDFTSAGIVDKAGIDVILVGDSASNIMAGHETTLPITLDQMIYHASSVIRGVERALVVVDLPFGTYQSDSQAALESAIRIMKESGSHAVKLEGGKQIKDSIKRIIKAGIPVMGHLGLTPQSIYKFGTYTVRAKEDKEANQLIEDAHLLKKIGCFAIVLEKVPSKLAEKVAKEINIPIIGIGAGSHVDGQVLVLHDLVGMTKEFNPRFLRRYMNLHDEMINAISNFSDDIKSGSFPNENEQY
jgi:3-methyl-2-oxobutanoate hydroxymethyltransferase